jgi:hypothetical protein
MTTDSNHQSTLTKTPANEEDWSLIAKKFPPFMRPFIGNSPAEVLGKFFPPKAIEAMGGLVSGIFPGFGVQVPEWVRQASYQFWKYYGFSKGFSPFASPKDFGVVIGLLDHAIRKPLPEQKSSVEKLVAKALPKMVSFLADKVTSDLSDLEKAQFYTGKHEAAKIFAKVENPNHLDMQALAKVYLVISAAWKEFEACDNHAARIEWLKAKKVIKKDTSADEVDKYKPSDRALYQAFETIGLPGAKPGKPKQTQN